MSFALGVHLKSMTIMVEGEFSFIGVITKNLVLYDSGGEDQIMF